MGNDPDDSIRFRSRHDGQPPDVGQPGLLAEPLAEEQERSKVRRVAFVIGATLSSPSVQIEPFKGTLCEKGWIRGTKSQLVYHCQSD